MPADEPSAGFLCMKGFEMYKLSQPNTGLISEHVANFKIRFQRKNE